MNDDFNKEKKLIDNHHCSNDGIHDFKKNLDSDNQNIRPGNNNNLSYNNKKPHIDLEKNVNYNDDEINKKQDEEEKNVNNNDDEINKKQDEEEKKEMIELKKNIINLLNQHQNIKSKYASQCNIKEENIFHKIQNIDDIEQLDNLIEYINFSIELENENKY